jgi:hypothetical protein
MRNHFSTRHALPLARARFLRCPNVATHVAGSEHFRVERNVARDVDSTVDCDEHRRVDHEVSNHVTNMMRDCALDVESLLPLPFTNLLTRPLTVL